MSFAPDTGPFARPESLLRVPVGFASPLWGLFAGAAVSGAAFWWMTRWARAENLEAMFGGAADATAAAAEATPEPILAAVEAVEAAPEPILEAAAEAVEPQPVLQALVEAEPAPEPVGGESAPISPVLQAIEPDAAQATPEPGPAAKVKKAPAKTV